MNVLGIEVPSTAPVFVAVLAVHVAAALVAVVSGAGAALVGPKGRGRHVRWGRVYVWSICVVVATATALAAMRFRHDVHLLLLGMLAFAAAWAGRLARRRTWPGDRGDAVHIGGLGGSYVVMLTAFYVDNGRHLPLWDRLPTAAYWLLPSLVGVPLIWRVIVTTARRRRPGRAGRARRRGIAQ